MSVDDQTTNPIIASSLTSTVSNRTANHTGISSTSSEQGKSQKLSVPLIIVIIILANHAESPQQNIAIPLALTTVLIALVVMLICLVLLLLWHKTKARKLKSESNFRELDASYSMLNRGMKQQTKEQAAYTPVDLYDQIQLSPSTGQSEPIPKNESEKTNIFTSISPDSHQMQESNVQELNTGIPETEKCNLEDLTYAIVDKTKKKKRNVDKLKHHSKSKTESHHKAIKDLSTTDTEESDAVENPNYQLNERKENPEEMYAVVYKKPKKSEEQDVPPVPAHTIEALYAAVQKQK